MSRRATLAPLLTLLLTGCPGGECPECPACPESSTTTDWDALYADLAAGGAVDAPVQETDAGNQLWEGETNIILNGPTAISIGEVFTVKPVSPSTTWTETWDLHERQTFVQPPYPIRLQFVPSTSGVLTQARLDALRAQDDADTTRTYSMGKALFSYLAFPSDAAIGRLPDQTPPGVTTATYEVFTVKGSAQPARSGGLYREISTVNGVERWRDTWVLYENFLSPYCVTAACDPANDLTVQAELRLVVGAAASAHLKSFLLDAKADRPGATTGWKYVPVAPYDLVSPLPANPP